MRIILTALAIPVLLLSRPDEGGDAYHRIQNANALYRSEAYAGALAAYQSLASEPLSPAIANAARFNLANTLFMQSSFRQAATGFTALAAQPAAPDAERSAAHFNAGNSLAALADISNDGTKKAALLRSALHEYRQSLIIEPDAMDTRINMEIVLRRLHPPPSSSTSDSQNSDRSRSTISRAMKQRVLNAMRIAEQELLKRYHQPSGSQEGKTLNKNW